MTTTIRLRVPDSDSGTPLQSVDGEAPFFFRAGLAIDADGSPHAYHPENRGLDHLANAGRPGSWWGLVTHDGTRAGRPIIQGADDPAPGYYVSTTALVDRTLKLANPRRYVDAETVPYFVLPPEVREHLHLDVRLGDFAFVIHPWRRRAAGAILADVGPAGKIGEGSMALAAALGLPSNPRRGGTNLPNVIYVVFPGSGDRAPAAPAKIAAESRRLFDAWKGSTRLAAQFPDDDFTFLTPAAPRASVLESNRALPSIRTFVNHCLSQAGERYVYGAEVRLDEDDPDGPWDCSELTEWAAHRSGGYLPDGSLNQLRLCQQHRTVIAVEAGKAKFGALLFRQAGDEGRHVAVSLGNGKTIEARGRNFGVGEFTATDRGWTHAALVPGFDYEVASPVPEPLDANGTPTFAASIALTSPWTRGPHVELAQQQLRRRGWRIPTDGWYDPRSEAVIRRFQMEKAQWLARQGAREPLVTGVIDPITWRALWEAAIT
jgi:cell wall-associated NlpC family hydrolase